MMSVEEKLKVSIQSSVNKAAQMFKQWHISELSTIASEVNGLRKPEVIDKDFDFTPQLENENFNQALDKALEIIKKHII